MVELVAHQFGFNGGGGEGLHEAGAIAREASCPLLSLVVIIEDLAALIILCL